MLENNGKTIKYSRNYYFTCDPAELASFLNNIISDISYTIPDQIPFLESKCRLILTELLTNALKHSTTNNTIFSVLIDSEKLQIKKIDNGRPFYLDRGKEQDLLEWPLQGYEGRKLVIYEDMMCCLYGYIKSATEIIFSTKDFPVQTPPRPKEILEHFGLMILTKASDRFIYVYHPDIHENVFQSDMYFKDVQVDGSLNN